MVNLGEGTLISSANVTLLLVAEMHDSGEDAAVLTDEKSCVQCDVYNM
jgi:hypothetical protein